MQPEFSAEMKEPPFNVGGCLAGQIRAIVSIIYLADRDYHILCEEFGFLQYGTFGFKSAGPF